MVPVDHVALCITLAAVSPQTEAGLTVLHVRARPPPTYNTIFSCLSRYGFTLLHFVLDDLPTSTQSPDLDDSNMRTLLKGHEDIGNRTVSDALVAKYLSWLILVEFLPKPSLPGADLPELGNSSVRKALGRSGA
jgi:L-aminoadipate-semialdehyde dehydrogenase